MSIKKECEFCREEILGIRSKRFCDDFCQRKHYYRRPEINRRMKLYSKEYNQNIDKNQKLKKKIEFLQLQDIEKEEKNFGKNMVKDLKLGKELEKETE